MKKPKWIPEHTRDGKEPESWDLKVKKGGPRITVHRYIHDPGAWYLSTNRFMDLFQVRLKNADVEKAKVEALARVHAYLTKVLGSLPEDVG